MTSNDNEDPTVPGRKFPDGPESKSGQPKNGKGKGKAAKAKPPLDGLDATMPSGNAEQPTGDDGLDLTMPSGRANQPAGDGGMDLTMPSGSANQPAGDGGLDLTMPTGSASQKPSGDDLDLTAPAGNAGRANASGGQQGAEDATMPSGSVPDDRSEDATMASGSASGSEGSASEDATMPSGNVSASEDPTIASGSEAGGDGKAYNPNELMGKEIGGCRVDKLLGRGAMGAVYKARQLKLDRDVAVKVIRPEMMTDPRMLKRFQVEARTVGKFNSANVVMVHDVGFEHGVHYLVMEFVEGKDLRQHVKLLAGGRLPAGEALPLIRQACKGLEEARRLKVVHRDIKPDNLMLTNQNVLKIADFGIAKPEEDFSMTLTSELIGTPLYMSPEQCQGGGDIDFRSDMYSLGATFFYLLTGEPPIRASSVYELIQTKTKMENLCLWKSLPELDENHPLSRVIERMTANDREDRYESYEELLNDLLLVEAGETITVRAKRIKKETQEREEQRHAGAGEADGGRGGLMVLVLLLLVGAGGGGYWWWSNQQKGSGEVVDGGGNGGGNGGRNNGGKTRERNDGNSGKDATAALQAARTALAGYRERFADADFENLKLQLAAAKVPDALQTEWKQFVSDVEKGARIDADVAGLTVPTPKVPFDGVEPFFAELAKATGVAESDGDELSDWATKLAATKRSEAIAVMGPAAVAALVEARNAWQAQLGEFRGDGPTLSKLQEGMGDLRNSRANLLRVLPSQEQALQAAVPVDSLGALELALIRAAFLSSPARVLDPQNVTATESALIEERTDLRTAMALYNRVSFPRRFEAPQFEAVVTFREDVDKALEKVDGGRELPPWLVAAKQELRRDGDLLQGVVKVCGDAWQASAKRFQEEDYDGLDVALDELSDAVARAKALFPGEDAARKLHAAVPPSELEQTTAGLQAAMEAAIGDKARSAWRTLLKGYKAELNNLSLATWNEAEFRKKEEELREALRDMPEASRTGLDRGLKQFATDCLSWKISRELFDAAATKLGDGQLMQCLESLKTTPSAPGAARECRDLLELARECQAAFQLVQGKLLLSDAVAKLAAAKVAASGMSLDGAEAQIETWRKGIASLKNATTGMQPFAAGKANKPNVEVVKSAFFMAETECSVGQFRKFLAACKKDGVAAVAPKLWAVAANQQSLKAILRKNLPTSSDSLPVSANWYEAAAYCEWKGLALPTFSEWALAAFGTDGVHTFPWRSDEMSRESEDCNFGQRAVEVDSGGKQGGRMRHLAGNVSEWLFTDGNGFKAKCVGGGYMDTPRSAERYASGAEQREDDRQMSRRDVGFRTVLRPQSFAGLVWPKDWQN